MTSFDYVLNDLRKKQKQFMIGVMTIFLVVGFITFLDSLVQIAPAVFMMTAQTTNGDVDLKISIKGATERTTMSNSNFYDQSNQLFSYKQHSEDDEVFDKEKVKEKRAPFSSPFMNFTKINEQLSTSDIYDGAYPRWTALSKAINPVNRKKHTSAFTIIAVSHAIIFKLFTITFPK